MSDCCRNPGVGAGIPPGTLPDPEYASYRPGEVRLYGRPAACRPIFTISEREIDERLEAALSNKTATGTDNKEAAMAVKKVFAEYLSDTIIGAKGEKVTLALFIGSEVCSLPVHVNIKDSCCGDDGEYLKSIGVIYGYAYEGHCYKLPKPQIMFLPTEPREILGGECGCDCGYVPELGYAVWQIDKLKSVIAVDVRSDDIKTLVLDENMPGNRSPLTYAQTMALAPQRYRD
ncbi:hypothetical protein PYH37_004548 [Sinorhizobium numidicum]|uniref:Uncharacterized protein n=1 Tax=Sinorhizobium numidicum TaxID=680248 RepID=A0ABY8CWF2_9HYPH|nr:hypothetical protein [Sinorhizobium numidicum]WEX76254.1 hypothetical protein PYH37_004548 [Sinorhizobium numidicum]WEX82914.1 hypothetical protein PYH38_005260 [Sinorhizobium numidicum]